MPIIITWNKRNPYHTGSTELNGVAGRPMVYQHPQDMGGTPMTSSFSGWRYNQADYTNNNIIRNRLLLTIRGKNSYRDYRSYRRIAQAWTGRLPEPWQGQQNAARVFGFPLAVNLQSSGAALYEAFISVNPPAPNPTTLTLAASGWCLVFSRTRFRSRIGGGRAVDSTSKIYSDRNIISETRRIGRAHRPFDLRFGRVSSTYRVTIPPGASIKVGEITAGLGYTIASGTNAFLCASYLRFLFGAAAGGGVGPSGGSSPGSGAGQGEQGG